LLQSYRHVSDVLPYSAPIMEPPPALRDRLIAAVEAEAAAAAAPAVAAPAQPIARPRRAPTARLLWGALAAALATIVALLGWNVSLQQQLATQARQVSESRVGWQKMIVLMDDPAVQMYRLTGGASFGTLWGTPAGQEGCIMLEDLPEPAPGAVYQVWLRDSAGWSSAGVFEPRGPKAWFIFSADQPLQHYTSALVTVEPDGGSDQPGGREVVRGDLGVQRT
jgi:hypothetical protein